MRYPPAIMVRPARPLLVTLFSFAPLAPLALGALGALGVLGATALLPACSHTSTVNESRALSVDLDMYRTGTVEVEPKGLDEKEIASFLAYLETKLKATGALEPVPADKGPDLVVRVRNSPSATGDEDLRMLVDFVDTKTRATVGQIVVTGTATSDRQATAFVRAADEIAGYLRSSRKQPASASKGRGGGAPAAATLASEEPNGGVVKEGKCTTTCRTDTGSDLPPADRQRVADATHPMLSSARACLDRMNAQAVEPTTIFRFEQRGQMLSMKIDAGGFEDLACIAELRSRPPTVTVSGPGSVRCEHRCAK